MVQLESAIERKFVNRLRDELGLIALKLDTSSDSGWPDRLVLLPGGRPVLVELKRPGETTRVKQNYQLGRLEDLGYAAASFTNPDAAVQWVKLVLNRFQLESLG